MANEKPEVAANNAHFLKGHASWLYCDGCNKTVAYLCYVTYRYFAFSFTCKCGCSGWVENKYGGVDVSGLAKGELAHSAANNRYACSRDGSALFSPVAKNLASYTAEVVCKQCNTKYTVSETYEFAAP